MTNNTNALYRAAAITTLLVGGLALIIGSFIGLSGLSLLIGCALGAFGTVLVATKQPKLPARPARATSSPAATSTATSANTDNGDVQTLFVGNLAFRANRHGLSELFGNYGTVINARVVTDRNTRKPKGYGFVEMNAIDADSAIEALNGHEFMGRTLNVSIAKDSKTRS